MEIHKFPISKGAAINEISGAEKKPQVFWIGIRMMCCNEHAKKVFAEQADMRIVFWYLTAFQQVGGIERFNRAFMKALSDIALQRRDIIFQARSVYDQAPDEKYISKNIWKGFGGNRLGFAFHVWRHCKKRDIIIAGHIHLIPIVCLVKIFHPSCRVIYITHGIEVWKPMSKWKRHLLQRADKILAVSEYTKKQLIDKQKINASKIEILPNTLDPYFHLSKETGKPESLLHKYGLGAQDKILLSICR
ncbi:MAG: glycosyltransferase, partial [Thermoflavifilum sp.]|nr:glycosyltransferase [Thermoflavifilum sp.]